MADPTPQRKLLMLAIPVGGIFLGTLLGLVFGPAVKGGGIGTAGLWFGGAFLLAAAGAVLLLRNAPARAPAAPAEEPAATRTVMPAAPPAAFPVQIAFPDIAPRYPEVWGLDAPLQVRVQAPAQHAGAPVALIAWHEGQERFRREGTLGASGEAAFTLTSATPADLHLDVRVTTPSGLGRGGRMLRFNRYEEEIKHTFADFRAWALERIGREDRPGLTAREIVRLLQAPPEAQKHLMEVVYVLEVIAYGEREVDRNLYLHFLEALLALDETGFFTAPPGAERASPELARAKRGGG